MKKEWLFTATWFEGNNIKEASQGEAQAIDFKTREEALAFYNEHCKDEHKYFMHVTQLNVNSPWEIYLVA